MPAALLIAFGSIVSASGIAVLTASLAPVAMPASANPLAAGDTGQGCVASLMLALGILALVVLAAPFAVMIYFVSERSVLLGTLVAAVAALAGVGAMWVAIKGADNRLSGHEAALVDMVAPRR